MSKKIKIGIDINEVIRAKWLQFDRFYVQEFTDEGIPTKNGASSDYVYDFFNNYKWNDVVEVEKELKEPENMPENISPVHYQLLEGEKAPLADAFLFKMPVETKLTAKEVYNRFMYQDYLLEIHGAASMMYRGMDLHVNQFLEKYKENAEFTLISIENKFSIPPTLFFLSKITSRFTNYKFYNNYDNLWNDFDVIITTDPEFLKKKTPWFKKLIKLKRPYNEFIGKGSIEALQIADLMEDKTFQKIIKYKNK